MQHRTRTAPALRQPTRTVAALLIALVAGTVNAGGGQEVLEIRGKEMAVWPVAELRERGFDVQDVPRGQNAAWVYLDAWNTFLDLPNDLSAAFEYAYKTAWLAEQRDLRTWLTKKENRQAIRLATRAAGMERCQMLYFGDPDGSVISILLPALSHQRTLGRMVVADGRRLAARKDYRGAMDRFVTVLRMGHHTAEGVTLIEALVGVACWNLADAAVRDLVLRHDLPEDDLAHVFEEFGMAAPLMPDMRRGFEAERLFGPTMVDELISRPTRLLRNVRVPEGVEWFGGSVKPKDGWDRLEARLGRLFLPDRTIKRHMLEYYDAMVEVGRLPYHDDRVRGFNEEEMFTSIPQWDGLSRSLLPSLSRARTLGSRCRTDTRATALTVALMLHAKRSEGRFPAALSDLSVDLDADQLIDAFGGREFPYATVPGAWKFYSVGPDRSDDGGHVGERWDEEGSDLSYGFPPEPVEPFDASGN